MSNFLMQSTGPLPNWAWAGVIVIGGGIGLYISKKNAAAATPTADNTTPGTASVIGSNDIPNVVIVQGQPGPRGPQGPIAQTKLCPDGWHWDANAQIGFETNKDKKNGIIHGACVKDAPAKPHIFPHKPSGRGGKAMHTRRYITVNGDRLHAVAQYLGTQPGYLVQRNNLKLGRGGALQPGLALAY